jgi:hypothetical protein
VSARLSNYYEKEEECAREPLETARVRAAGGERGRGTIIITFAF